MFFVICPCSNKQIHSFHLYTWAVLSPAPVVVLRKCSSEGGHAEPHTDRHKKDLSLINALHQAAVDAFVKEMSWTHCALSTHHLINAPGGFVYARQLIG